MSWVRIVIETNSLLLEEVLFNVPCCSLLLVESYSLMSISNQRIPVPKAPLTSSVKRE